VLNRYDVSKPDLLASYYEHISRQISGYLNSYDTGSVLVTGGGAFNKFVIEKISSKTRAKLVIPDQLVVNYKEAIIFAFLGFLRYNSQINCLASVTGARKDSSAGAVFLP
jgi:anhydro-N-acetylmuramic acid kinase